jgi:hypothetical protein
MGNLTERNLLHIGPSVCVELIKPVDVTVNEIFCKCVQNSELTLITVVGLHPCDEIVILREDWGSTVWCGERFGMDG